LTAGPWRLDPARSTLEFEVLFYWGLGVVKGRFTRYAGTIDLQRRPAVALTIEADSVRSGHARRDRRLRSGDFFAVAEHPRVRFVSESARLRGDALKVKGKLSARGRVIDVEVDAVVRPIDGEYELVATTFVMHRWLGMTWNPLGVSRPYSKLIVAARLVPAAVSFPEAGVSLPEARVSLPEAGVSLPETGVSLSEATGSTPQRRTACPARGARAVPAGDD
jgi:polyisoprenoid-binding protein YceI